MGRMRGNSAAGPGARARSFPRKRVGGAPSAHERQIRKIELGPIWTDERQRRTYGNGERYFLRKLRSSYWILTDERNSYVLATATATATIAETDSLRNAGHQAWGRIPFSPNRLRILSLNRFRFACANFSERFSFGAVALATRVTTFPYPLNVSAKTQVYALQSSV